MSFIFCLNCKSCFCFTLFLNFFSRESAMQVGLTHSSIATTKVLQRGRNYTTYSVFNFMGDDIVPMLCWYFETRSFYVDKAGCSVTHRDTLVTASEVLALNVCANHIWLYNSIFKLNQIIPNIFT